MSERGVDGVHPVGVHGKQPRPSGPAGAATAQGTHDLKRKTARGALTSVVGQGANFVLRTASMVVLARLVTPEHFGLVGMVTAFTGLLGLFRDGGLTMATVQRERITQEQTSTLFWINVAIGGLLAAIAAVVAPLLASFYGDPRLFWISVALGSAFLFNGALAQHRALLQRSMRFGALVIIDIIALVFSICLGVGMALAGMGYWALVAMAVSQPAIGFAGMWLASGWVPGFPRRGSGIRSMLNYGGVVTLNSVVVYVAYNVDKVLLGRFWGAEVLGVYGRAYQLISIPTENLHTTIGWVMFPALSRVQGDPPRLRNYFLKGYGLFLSAVMPITLACALFAEDIVLVLLGAQWTEAVPVFQLLAPTILALALVNPMGYLMQAIGHQVRSLLVAFMILPVVIVGYTAGLPFGPKGVALGYSIAMCVLVVPVILWARRGTLITGKDILKTVLPPFAATLVGAATAIAARSAMNDIVPFWRLTALTALLFGVHGLTLLYVLGQKQMYLDMLQAIGIWQGRRSPAGHKG